MSFGTNLREQRTKAGKTMGDLARYLGTTVSFICSVELGRRALTYEQIIQTEKFLNASLLPAQAFCHPTLTHEQTAELILLVEMKIFALETEAKTARNLGALPFSASLYNGEDWADMLNIKIETWTAIRKELEFGKNR